MHPCGENNYRRIENITMNLRLVDGNQWFLEQKNEFILEYYELELFKKVV